MTYSLLDQPPPDLKRYTVISAAYRALFVDLLVTEFTRKTPYIRTTAVPIDWVVSASGHDSADSYEISMERIPVDSGPLGNSHGVFYFAYTYRS